MNTLAGLLGLFLSLGSIDQPTGPKAQDESGERPLAMTRAVACSKIHGFEDFELLADSRLTADDKLLVYYKPLNYQVDLEKGRYKIHLTQEGRLRRRGDKTVLWKKAALLDYEVDTDKPPGTIYLMNTIATKGLPPGEYDLDIVLRDERAGGRTATQVLKFQVVPSNQEPASEPGTVDEPAGEKDGTVAEPVNQTRKDSPARPTAKGRRPASKPARRTEVGASRRAPAEGRPLAGPP